MKKIYKCKKCGKPLRTEEASIEYCDGYCTDCYDSGMTKDKEVNGNAKLV